MFIDILRLKGRILRKLDLLRLERHATVRKEQPMQNGQPELRMPLRTPVHRPRMLNKYFYLKKTTLLKTLNLNTTNYLKELNDYFPEYENYMNQVRLSAQNEKCRFGRSKESKILIGIIAVGGFTLLVIGLMIGHCSIIAYRKLVVSLYQHLLAILL